VSRKSQVAGRESDDLATVHVYTTRSDAEIARAKLVGEGIDALVIADDEGGLNPGFYDRYGVRVVVRSDQVAAARAALDIDSLTIPSDALEAMIQHARSAAPEEACGLFAVGEGVVVSMVYCLTNTQHSSTAYTIEPSEHYHAWDHARRNGWEIGGVFHSHPTSAAVPSPADLVGLDPDWVSVILGAREIRAYRVRDGIPTEVVVQRG
jgi:proteasome lid subunit RPN8/RPN11